MLQLSMQKLTPKGATWDVYRVRSRLSSGAVCLQNRNLLLPLAMQCHQGEFPELEIVDQYTGIFITGSPVSANDTQQEWIQKQKQWVLAFAGVKRQCKLVASCYGCQVICFSGFLCFMAVNVSLQICMESFLHDHDSVQ